jgi:hypothetical protein
VERSDFDAADVHVNFGGFLPPLGGGVSMPRIAPFGRVEIDPER